LRILVYGGRDARRFPKPHKANGKSSMQLHAHTNADIIGASRQNASEASQVVDLTKLDPAVTAQHLRKPEGEIGRALADSMAERNWPVYEAAIKLVGLRPAERLIEIGFGNGKLV
jgi:hypothetical protein